MAWAAEAGISFLDLPGNAQGNSIIDRMLAEEVERYRPAVTLSIWAADWADLPGRSPGREHEILVINNESSSGAVAAGDRLHDAVGRGFVFHGWCPPVLVVVVVTMVFSRGG